MGIELLVAAGISAYAAYSSAQAQTKAAKNAQNVATQQNSVNQQIAAAQAAQNTGLANTQAGQNQANTSNQIGQNTQLAFGQMGNNLLTTYGQIGENTSGFQNAMGYLTPYATGGSSAFQNALAGSGALGAGAQQQYMAGFTGGPYLQGMIKNAGEALNNQYAATGRSPYGGNAINALYSQNASLWNNSYQQQLQNLLQQANVGLGASNSILSGYGQLAGVNSGLISNLNSVNSNISGNLSSTNSGLTSALNSANTGLTGSLMGSNTSLAGGNMSAGTQLANINANAETAKGQAQANMYNTIGGIASTAVGKLPPGTFSNMLNSTGSNGWAAQTVPASSLA
jgi:hypothetical protein